MLDSIKSPITTSNNIKLKKTLNATDVVKLYHDEIKLDVRDAIGGINEIQIYQCIESGAYFYYPPQLAGDKKFYSELSHVVPYYIEEKEEYRFALQHIKKTDTVLEIGCGDGHFLELLNKNNILDIYGADLNSEAIAKVREKGFKVFEQAIENPNQEYFEKFDIIVMFQVLEHIPNVKPFLDNALRLLKTGGKLIIAVPYNNPYYAGRDQFQVMNLPPHHMIMWTPESLIKLSNFFPITKIDGKEESIKASSALYQIQLITKRLFRGHFHLFFQSFFQCIRYTFHVLFYPFNFRLIKYNQIAVYEKIINKIQ
jgi:methionine biosynthesis protein MetW